MPGTLAIASCSRGSNGVPGAASIVGHALALEELAELAVDGGDALEPRVCGDRLGSRLDGAVEVVGEGQDLADEVLAGEAEVAHALLGRAPLEVLELGALALEGGEVLVGLDRA